MSIILAGSCWRWLVLVVLLAVGGCKASIDPSATASSYVRLLDTDPLASLACMREAGDGGLLFLYTAQPSGLAATHIELTKTDPNGNVLWTHTFGDSGAYQAGDCLVLSDGTIVLTGSHALDAKNDALDFFHLAADGSVMASTEQLSVLSLQAKSLQTNDSGGYVLACLAKNPLVAGNPVELLMLRLTGLGKFLDSTSMIPPAPWGFSQMSSTGSGAAFAAGYSHPSGLLPAPTLFERMEPDSIFKSSSFSGAGQFRSIIRVSATACVLAGDVAPYGIANGSAWVGKLDPASWNGSGTVPLAWSDTTHLGIASSMVSVVQTADGGFASTAFAASASGDTSIAVFRFDANGGAVWPYKTYSFNGGDVPMNIVELPNGDLIVGGVTTSFGSRASGARQIFLLHLKADGTPAS